MQALYRHILDHVFDARRKGKLRILHIRRDEAVANRRASLKGIPTKPGFDRDEYPPAMSDEGADVRYVRSAENRSASSVMRRQLTPYCNEQRFIIERWPNRWPELRSLLAFPIRLELTTSRVGFRNSVTLRELSNSSTRPGGSVFRPGRSPRTSRGREGESGGFDVDPADLVVARA
jgi:hypothetical protein